MKTMIDSTEPDFHKYEVFIHGVKQKNVIAADSVAGEVWRYQVDDNGDPTDNTERATGDVTILEATNGN